jgi:hypothetical protein
MKWSQVTPGTVQQFCHTFTDCQNSTLNNYHADPSLTNISYLAHCLSAAATQQQHHVQVES